MIDPVDAMVYETGPFFYEVDGMFVPQPVSGARGIPASCTAAR